MNKLLYKHISKVFIASEIDPLDDSRVIERQDNGFNKLMLISAN